MFKLIRRVLPVVVALTAVVATPAAVAQDPFPDFGKRFTQYAGNPLLTLESINPWNFPRPGEPYSAIPGTVHPDVLYFPEGKGGYKFWMVFTPYDGWNQGPNPPNNQCPPWTNNECPPAPWRTPVSYWERLTLVRSNDGINWTKAGIDIGVNPLFSPADPSIPCPQGYGEYHSDPDLVYAENKGPSGESWFLYFASSCEHDVIELALSHDGIHYTRWPHPVIPWENGHVVDGFPVAGPTVVYDVSVGTFFGWYFNPPITPGGISFATSTNGIDWTPASTPNCSPYGCWSNGVVRPDSASCEGGITHPDVIKKGSEFWMYYQAQPGDLYHDLMIRRATSTDGIHWTKDPTAILSKYQPQPPLQACATTNVMPTQWTFWKRTEPAPTPTNVTMFYRPSAVVVGDAMYLYFGGLDKTSYTSYPYERDIGLAFSSRFNDVQPIHFAYKEIEAVAQAQITAGCGNNNYCPDTLATRKVIAIFIIKGRNLPPSTAPYNAYFDDIANDEYAPFINAMYENQISVGCGPRAYCPDGNATRAQLPVMIVNALQETPSTAAYNAYFDDIANDAYAPFINRVFELAINAGCGTRLFCPTTNVDRAQLAVSTAEAFLWN